MTNAQGIIFCLVYWKLTHAQNFSSPHCPDRPRGPLWKQFLDQGQGGEIWRQRTLCQTYNDFLVADKEWVSAPRFCLLPPSCCIPLLTRLSFLCSYLCFLLPLPLPLCSKPWHSTSASAAKGRNTVGQHALVLYLTLTPWQVFTFPRDVPYVYIVQRRSAITTAHEFINMLPTAVSCVSARARAMRAGLVV